MVNKSGPMISLDDMLVFARVVSSGSFTQAAQELGLGKARVSQIVTRLENQLGARLLNRTTRSLALTDAGQDYYQYCLQIGELAEQANQGLSEQEDEPSGFLRLATPLGGSLTTQLLSGFLQRYPKVSLDIVESDGYQNLIESRCDLAIRASSSLEDSSLYATQIGQFSDIICASPTYLDQVGEPKLAEDLLSLAWISHEIVHGDRQLSLCSPQGERRRLRLQPRVLVRSTQTLLGFLKQGLGFGIMPSFVVANELASGELVQLLPQVHQVSIPVYAVYQEKALMPRRLRCLIEHLKTQQQTF